MRNAEQADPMEQHELAGTKNKKDDRRPAGCCQRLRSHKYLFHYAIGVTLLALGLLIGVIVLSQRECKEVQKLSGAEEEKGGTTQTGSTVCPSGWLQRNQSCYYFSAGGEFSTWNDSQKRCDTMGACLLIIEDQEEKGFIDGSSRGQAYKLFWIGAYRDGDGWRWVDGQRYDTSLSPISEGSSGNCIRIEAEVGYYNDDCQSKHRWICEKI